MILQGYPIIPLLERLEAKGQVRLKENFTESFLTDLAGNAMALPVLLAIFQAGMAAVGFKPCVQEASEDDVPLGHGGGGVALGPQQRADLLLRRHWPGFKVAE